MKEKFYITTPIYYPSAAPHIGHCYTTVFCDVIARYKRLKGFDVMFLTGTDDHGQKIENKARDAGVTPQEYSDTVVAEFRKLWDFMNISFDRFVRTTDDYHIKTVQHIFKALYDKGYIYKSKYTGKYCVPCESFWTETQLVDGKCPDCGREVCEMQEEAYFFKMSMFADKLRKMLENTDLLYPKNRVNEMIHSFIEPGLQDLCVSRTSFKWGVPVSFDDKHIVYVWIDALANYISALGYQNDTYSDFEKFWPADLHAMAKEIVRFHALVWPAILMALDLPLPKKIYSHGWITFGNAKMSKSLGNVVDPFLLGNRYGVDAVRYEIIKEMPFNGDYVFSTEQFLQTTNSDLANNLGNLVSRTFSMVKKYFDGKLPGQHSQDINEGSSLIKQTMATIPVIEEKIDSLHLSDALAEIFNIIFAANKYIEDMKPWELAKDESKKEQLEQVLYDLLETIRIVSILLYPFLPESMKKIWEKLGLSEKDIVWDQTKEYGALDKNVSISDSLMLFPRVNIEEEMQSLHQDA